MHNAKLDLARDFHVSSKEFERRARNFFGDGTLRRQLNDFWRRHRAAVEATNAEFWQEVVGDLHVQTMSALAGQAVGRDAVVAMSIHTMVSVFNAEREVDWMKPLARLGLASWLVDSEDEMVATMSRLSERLIAAIWNSGRASDDLLPDVLLLHRVSLLQFEIIAEHRARLEGRLVEQTITRQGTEFVGGLAGRIDRSLAVSRSVSEEARDAGEKVAALHREAAAAAAASKQSAQSMTAAARTASDLLTGLDTIGDGLADGRATLVSAMEQADRSVRDNTQLARSVTEIDAVVKAIAQIAEQTSILALNASIEAARAGAAGTGFAVVAQEVKDLARQTAQATEQVAAKIASVQAASRASQQSSKLLLENIGRVGDSNGELLGELRRQLDQIAAITDAIDETTRGVAGMEELVHAVSRDTDAVAGIVQRLSASSSDSAGQLATLVEETGAFMRRIGT